MSIPLNNINLSGAIVGQTFTIDLTPIGQSAGAVSSNPSTVQNKAHLVLHNDSGVGLQLLFDTGAKGKNLPAGAWRPIELEPGTSKVLATVQYIIPNQPVTLLMIEYYFPGEPVSEVGILGNSPIGVTGKVTTTQMTPIFPQVIFSQASNTTLTSGVVNNQQVSGAGHSVPSIANWVLLSCFWDGSAINTYVQVYGNTNAPPDPAGRVILGSAQVANNLVAIGGVWVALDVNGTLNFLANNGNATGFTCSVLGWA